MSDDKSTIIDFGFQAQRRANHSGDLRMLCGTLRDLFQSLFDGVVQSVLEKQVAAGCLAIGPDGRARIPEERFFISDEIIGSLV